jgi:proline iminopeptidase
MATHWRSVGALIAGGAVALASFIAFAWFGLGFVPLAAIALVAFWVVAVPLLRLAARRAPSAGGGEVRLKVRWWLLAGTAAYVLIAQLLVGNRPMRTVSAPEPVPGVRYWSLANGSRLAYVHAPARGTRREMPVIVLHDGPGMPALPRLQRLAARPFDFLANEGFDVYYYDQVGAGLSDRIDLGADPPYTVERHVQDLEEIRRTLGAANLLLIGEGWGATLATQYVLHHADRVAQVVLESPAPLWYGDWPSFIDPAARARMTDVQSSALAVLQRPTPRLVVGRMMSDFNPRVAHAVVPDWEVDQWWTRYQEESLRLGQPRLTCASTPPDGLVPLSGLGFFAYSYTLRDAIRLPDPRPALATFQTPVLIVRGTCDYIDWQVSYEYLRALPKARYVAIPAAGHLIWMDQASMHEEVLRAFVNGAPLPLEFYDAAQERRG